jgi:hypothetical protein
MSDKTEKVSNSEKRLGINAIEQGLITRDQPCKILNAHVDEDLE